MPRSASRVAPGSQERGVPTSPSPREEAGGGQQGCRPVWPEGNVCAAAWSPPPPGPAGPRPPPGWGRVNTATGSRDIYTEGRAQVQCPPQPLPCPACRHSQPRASVAPAGKGMCSRHSLHWAWRPAGVGCTGCQRRHWGHTTPPPLKALGQNAGPHFKQLLENIFFWRTPPSPH